MHPPSPPKDKNKSKKKFRGSLSFSYLHFYLSFSSVLFHISIIYCIFARRSFLRKCIHIHVSLLCICIYVYLYICHDELSRKLAMQCNLQCNTFRMLIKRPNYKFSAVRYGFYLVLYARLIWIQPSL